MRRHRCDGLRPHQTPKTQPMNLQDTIEAVQRKVGVEADGDPRGDTWHAIGTALGAQLGTVEETIKDCQRKVNVEDDGEPGPQTWGAIAKALGVTVSLAPMPGGKVLFQLAGIAETQIGTQEDTKHTNNGAAI